MQPTLRWEGDAAGTLHLLDQTRLPHQQVLLRIERLQPLLDAIGCLAVRGAPALGVAAAYGMVLGVRERAPRDVEAFVAALEAVGAALIRARPTAVNLPWAVRRMQAVGRRTPQLDALFAEAGAIEREDIELCARIGRHGQALVRDGMTVLTHCNTGRLATAGDGTALAVLFAAWRLGRRFTVLADETRPLLQGSRLTALELHAEGIPVRVLPDSAAAGLIARGAVQLVLTGADRIASNGDAANKVGTYGLALACKEHHVPMYIAAPASTFDLALRDGTQIPIEERAAEEVLSLCGQRIAAAGVGACNPAFDVTPARFLTGLITDRGLITPVTADAIKKALA